MLKDVYDFAIADIALILAKTEGVVKHLLVNARANMSSIFSNKCALVSKTGICHQCSELNGVFNPKQNQQEQLLKLEMVGNPTKYNTEELLNLRTQLVKSIDPLNSPGMNLQEVLMQCNRRAAALNEVV